MKWWKFATISWLIELNRLFHYPKIMLKRLTHFATYILLVLMPMQALATANMLVCNSVMQSIAVKHTVENGIVSEMPCHQPMTTKSNQQSDYKASCKTACASLCALTAITVDIQSNFALNSTQVFDFKYQLYISIPQQNLQRPPITFI